MPVDIERALREGAERTVARNGLAFVGILFALGLANGVIAGGVARTVMRGSPAPGMPGMAIGGPSLAVPPAVAGGASLVFTIVSLVITIAAIRTFVSDETERIPTEYATRNVVLAALNLVIGTIVFGIAVAIGLVLLIVPGVFLLVSLFFWAVYVTVEDQNFVAGMRNSWTLTRGHRWRLLAIGIAVAIVGLVVNAVVAVPAVLLPGAVAFVFGQLASAVVTIFWFATLGATYNQLVALEETNHGAAGEDADEDQSESVSDPATGGGQDPAA